MAGAQADCRCIPFSRNRNKKSFSLLSDHDSGKRTVEGGPHCWTYFLLFIGVPLASAVIYGLFFTQTGLYILAATAVILFLVLAFKKSPAALVVLLVSGSILIFSAHDIWAVLFFWFISAIITWVALNLNP